MKKILIFLMIISSLVFSAQNTKKAGCILSQDGKVIVNWESTDGKVGTFKEVDFIPIRKEGVNFKEVFVGSKIKINSVTKTITLEIIDITSNPRVKPDPRTGTITFTVLEKSISQKIKMNYVYDKNTMNIKGKTNIYDFNMLDLKIKLKAILCNV